MSYIANVKSMFVVYGCNNCHGGAGPASQYRPDVYTGLPGAFAGIVEAGNEAKQLGECDVIKGDANNSYIVRKLEDAPGILGSHMPPGASPTVNATQVAWLRLWIDQGAPNN